MYENEYITDDAQNSWNDPDRPGNCSMDRKFEGFNNSAHNSWPSIHRKLAWSCLPGLSCGDIQMVVAGRVDLGHWFAGLGAGSKYDPSWYE